MPLSRRSLPAPKTIATGELLLSWDVQFESPAGVDTSRKLPVDLKYRDAEVGLSWPSATSCSLESCIPSSRSWGDLRNSGYAHLWHSTATSDGWHQ